MRAGAGLERADQDEADGYAPLSEINVTPLVDVMLVLLIIFMVAAPLMMASIPVQLPKSASAKPAQPKQPLVISVNKDGALYLGEDEITAESFIPQLRTLAAEDKERIVLVRGDRTIAYGRVMEVMDQIGAAGFSRVSLIAEIAGAKPAVEPAP